jgi:hypothetical protein
MKIFCTVVSGRLNVVKGLKPTNQIDSFERSWLDLLVDHPSQDLFGQRPQYTLSSGAGNTQDSVRDTLPLYCTVSL